MSRAGTSVFYNHNDDDDVNVTDDNDVKTKTKTSVNLYESGWLVGYLLSYFFISEVIFFIFIFVIVYTFETFEMCLTK